MVLINANPPPLHGTRRGTLIALQVILCSIAIFVYSLRVYTRARILRSFSSDDILMGVAMLFSILMSINACISTKFGSGTHQFEVPPSDFPGLLIGLWISELTFTCSATFMKLSVLVFYLRLAVTRTYKIVIWGSIAFIICLGVGFVVFVICQCHPPTDYWVPTATTCLDPTIPLFVHGLSNTLTDFYIYILPMRMVWKIQLAKRQRMGLIAVFAAGFLVCLAGVLRLYYSITTDVSHDSTWEGTYLWTWETAELDLGIICASLPSLKKLITRIMPKIFGSTLHSKTASRPTVGYQLGSRPQQQELWPPSRSGVGGSGNAEYILESIVNAKGVGVAHERESQEELTKGHAREGGIIVTRQIDVSSFA